TSCAASSARFPPGRSRTPTRRSGCAVRTSRCRSSRAGAARSATSRSPTISAGSTATRSSIRRSTTGPASRSRCATSRSPTFRSATRASTSRTAGTTCEVAMLKILLARLQQGHRTGKFPVEEPVLAERFRGRPAVDPTRCPDGCRACIDACPTGAITAHGSLALDTGKCLFCTDCIDACPDGAIRFTGDYRLAARTRSELVVGRTPIGEPELLLGEELRRLYGRSLKLRQVSAGGCNACEADVNVLGTVVFDLARFGIQSVASPRHADGLLITGPVTENMRLALKKTYDAVPD